MQVTITVYQAFHTRIDQGELKCIYEILGYSRLTSTGQMKYWYWHMKLEIWEKHIHSFYLFT